MAKKDELNIEVSKEVFEKVIAELKLIYNEPYHYFKGSDGYVFNEYWHYEATGLVMAKRFNGYSDLPEDDPNSKPRYFLDEHCAKKVSFPITETKL